MDYAPFSNIFWGLQISALISALQRVLSWTFNWKEDFPLSSYLPYEITYVILVYWSMIYPHLVECKFHWVKNHLCFLYHIPLPCWLSGNESACNAGDPSLIPGWGRSPGERKGYPLQYSCLENSMKREVWQATVHGVTAAYNRTTKRIYNIPYRPELGFK